MSAETGAQLGIMRCQQTQRDTMCPAVMAQDPQTRNLIASQSPVQQ